MASHDGRIPVARPTGLAVGLGSALLVGALGGLWWALRRRRRPDA
ncbi:hypothetical protein [Actinomadura harenae]|nr:hypothetical protein [Actinomadura harenae]